MIGTIRKHSKAMWWVIIAAIIITFVWWGSQGPQNGNGGGSGNYGVMNGVTITPDIYQKALREVKLYYFFNSGGNWPGRGRQLQNFDVERETFNRILITLKMKELGVHVDDEAVSKVASDRMRSLGRDGKPVSLKEFETAILTPEKLTTVDFERYIRNELGIQQLFATLGMAGDLVSADEVRALYQRDYQKISAQIALFSGRDYVKSVVSTPEKINEFYTNQMQRYELPERVRVNYVAFPFSNYLAAAKIELDNLTNLAELVENAVIQMGTNYPAGVNSPEEAKARLIENEQKRFAGSNALKAAQDFNKALTEATPAAATNIVTLAKERGLTAQVTMPFSQNEAPAGLDVGVDFVRAAYSLTTAEPFCDPVPGSDAFYVISYHSQLPSEIPSLDSIRDRVTQDYQFIESAMLAQKAAIAFEGGLSNAMAGGKSFADACDQAGVKLTPLAPFSMSSTNIAELSGHVRQDQFNQFKRVALATAPGQLTSLMPSADGAFMALVQARLPLDEAELKQNLPSFTRSVHQVRRNEVFNEWFKREAQKAFATVPYFQEKQAQMQKAATSGGAKQ
jgi:hypothetical protein